MEKLNSGALSPSSNYLEDRLNFAISRGGGRTNEEGLSGEISAFHSDSEKREV